MTFSIKHRRSIGVNDQRINRNLQPRSSSFKDPRAKEAQKLRPVTHQRINSDTGNRDSISGKSEPEVSLCQILCQKFY